MTPHQSQPDDAATPRRGMNLAGDSATRMQELVLVKKDRRYVFRCAPGEEAALLGQLRTLAQDPKSEVTWFDAAMMSHQIGRKLAGELKGVRGN